MNRNAPCACGSGKRFKHCCGREGAPIALPTRSQALAAHRAGSLRSAETLYRQALAENPGDVDVLHMLGVVQLERLRYRESLDLIFEAAERTGWAQPQVRHNLGLVLSKMLVGRSNARQTDVVERFLAWEQSHGGIRSSERPLVSVIIPALNQARFVGEAIASVAAQTYSNLEILIIDRGSTDGTAEIVARQLAGLPVPAKLVVRPDRGAPAALNDGAAIASGQYLAFLEADESYAGDRLASLVDGIANTGVAWGFSLVAPAPGEGTGPGSGEAAPAASFWQLQQPLLGSVSNSFALVQNNVAVSVGNLFVERDFFLGLGGFGDLRFQYDWDFCLRAAAGAEPMVVRRPLLFCRLRGIGMRREPQANASAEAAKVLGDLVASVVAGGSPCANPLAPQWPGNRDLLLTRIMGAAQGALVPVPAMRELVAEVRSGVPLAVARRPEGMSAAVRRTAVVVLGMHRSGTSALARVLNLCGAFLPVELLAPNGLHNPTGYWEPEAIVKFNERVLRRLGGDWNHVDFELPEGDFVEEFVHDVAALLASEYGDAPTILIKDPRMGLLAPLWHRALAEAGYRTVYVVPLRDPLEVARSLAARGNITEQGGLALWLAYTSRIAAFSESVTDVMHVRFTDLFDDWRGTVARIAARLDVALDVAARAEDVDRFLQPSMRRQRSDSAALEALPADAVNDEVRARYRALLARCEQESGGNAAQASKNRTAVVVLGMHRSGTSAFARTLNLCGAYLPANLRPPKLRNNPKGLWEPEEVVNLNERTLRQLGGAWNRVDFALQEGEVADAFLHDARALLAAEYGDRPTIVIKDPRLCVLAQLWQRALTDAGYRAVYVVPIRDPIEVAQSLQARGDMTVPDGLALWLAYMKRIAAFADSVESVMYVRYIDLVDDWRGVLGRMANRFDLALDIDSRAGEVDRFLERALHRQRSAAAALAALPENPVNAEVRALYEAALARCASNAAVAEPSLAAGRRRIEFVESPSGTPAATASFVLCIENNAIRDQAILLCESIREFGGNYRDSPILAFSPRAGLAVDRDTRRALADMRVEYVDEPINTLCTEYGSANRVYAGAWAEAHTDSDFMVVLDSDTVFLREPCMPSGADVAVRPVDTKGSATRGPSDAFEGYWIAIAGMCGIPIDRLPFIRATIDGERIRASYNGGLIVARRSLGILTRAAEVFSRSVKEGLRPYRGGGIDVLASTGPVGRAGSEYWGSNQAVLALAIWAATDRVVHYPASYNVPLHLVASAGEIDADWHARPPVHVHYHSMFVPQRYEIAMEIMAKLGVSADRLAWLAERIPFTEGSQARQVA